MDIPYKLTYDDVLLKPLYSEVDSRSMVDLNTCIGQVHLSIPIISSPMDTVTGYEMAKEIHRLGGLGIIHRFQSIDQQKSIVRTLKSHSLPNVAVAVGADDIDRFESLLGAGANVFCIDIAHGWSGHMRRMLERIHHHKQRADFTIIAGSVANYDGALDLLHWGADVIRCGVGEGAVCLTRINTGVGVPMISSIVACKNAIQHFNSDLPAGRQRATLIADGGIKTPGDAAKALAAGAHAVMLGRMLAGCKETPGKMENIGDGKLGKKYRGMASADVQMDTGKTLCRVEGGSVLVPIKGPVESVVSDICNGIQSSCSYLNATDLREFRKNAVNRFIQVTPLGAQKNGIHA